MWLFIITPECRSHRPTPSRPTWWIISCTHAGVRNACDTTRVRPARCERSSCVKETNERLGKNVHAIYAPARAREIIVVQQSLHAFVRIQPHTRAHRQQRPHENILGVNVAPHLDTRRADFAAHNGQACTYVHERNVCYLMRTARKSSNHLKSFVIPCTKMIL